MLRLRYRLRWSSVVRWTVSIALPFVAALTLVHNDREVAATYVSLIAWIILGMRFVPRLHGQRAFINCIYAVGLASIIVAACFVVLSRTPYYFDPAISSETIPPSDRAPLLLLFAYPGAIMLLIGLLLARREQAYSKMWRRSP
jgi:branched-subunit amino acid ABC-type transport system permease component